MKYLYILLGGVVGFVAIPGIFLLVITYIAYQSPSHDMYLIARILSIGGFIIGIYTVGSAVESSPQ